MSHSNSGGSEAPGVKVDGEEAMLHITDQSVMFEKEGKMSGFLRSAIQMVKPDGNAMIIAYSVGSEVKSVRIEPLTAVASLVTSKDSSAFGRVSVAGQGQVFEKLYWTTRRELEERLSRIQAEPENKNLRLMPEEETKYSQISRHMENLLGSKYGFNARAEDSPMSFWGLERQPLEVQLDVIKTLHISFLRLIVGPKAEISDIAFSSTQVWPEDWEGILIKFKLAERPFLSENFKRYLSAHWTSHPSERKPVLALS
jgi:hypothetical protein